MFVRNGNGFPSFCPPRSCLIWFCTSGGVSDEDEFRIKNGGSLSANEALWSRTSLFDSSNHLSALLLSPELSLPKGCKLDGESSSLLEFDFLRLRMALSLLEESLESFDGDGRFRGE